MSQKVLYVLDGIVFFVSVSEYSSRPAQYPSTQLDNDGYDRTAGAGIACIFVVDIQSKRVCDAEMSLPDDSGEYHDDGIDYDGRWRWAALSEYRSNSTATVVRINSRTREHNEVAKINDHVGTVVAGPSTGAVVTPSIWVVLSKGMSRLPAG